MNKTLLILLMACCHLLHAQDSLPFPTPDPRVADTNTQPVATAHRPIPKSRMYLAAGGSTLAYTTGVLVLSNAWYKNYARTPFHFFNDNNDWLQVDKAGHAFSAYSAARLNSELWRWAGLPRKQRIWVGGLSGTAFLTAVEILDGFSSGWGFSAGDITSNLAGSALFIGQELGWNEQRILLKFSFHRMNYHEPMLNTRADELFGSPLAERMLKDYNGQTYWLSINLKSFLKRSALPAWLNIAMGYGADGMFGGTENLAKDANGNITFNRTDIPRYRQWYLSPDIDLTKIKTRSRFLKTTFFLLSALKFPAPSIGFSKKGIEWNWLHL